MPRVRLVRAMHFSSAHSYEMPGASAEENQKIYGNLFRRGAGFGHNFKIEAHFEGEIDAQTGMIENLSTIDAWMKAVIERIDHRYINVDLNEFRERAATPENIAWFCFEQIQSQMGSSKARLVQVRLYEGENAWFDVMSEST